MKKHKPTDEPAPGYKDMKNARHRCRKYCAKHNLPVPEWAKTIAQGRKVKPGEGVHAGKPMPTEPPKEGVNIKFARERCRKYCKRQGIPIPSWAAYVKSTRDPLDKPKNPSNYDRVYARKVAKKRGVPIPEWAKLIKAEPRIGDDILVEPPNATALQRTKCRAYCRQHNLPIPGWAELKKPIDYTIKPAEPTSYDRAMCRDYCKRHGLDIPDWAKVIRVTVRTPKPSEPVEEAKARDRYNSCLVLTDVTLALRSGMEDFWRKAEKECECLNDEALKKAIVARSESAFAEAMRVCVEINPHFKEYGKQTLSVEQERRRALERFQKRYAL